MNDNKIKSILSIIIFILLGAGIIIFTMLYTSTTHVGFIATHKLLFDLTISVYVVTVLILGVIFKDTSKNFIYKLAFSVQSIVVVALIVLYVLNLTGLWEKIDSIESLRRYVEGFGNYAIFAFIIMQILQVVVLPIPGFVAVGTGVALFGPWLGSIYSLIGILIGTFIAFFIGRKLGYKVASWVAGKENIDKGLQLIKGKDRVVLTLMFLLPFFPDDVLCFVAGLSSMSTRYFAIMITITRIISTVSSAFSMSGKLIPFDTVWGLVLWAIIILVTALFAYLVYKKGDKIEKFFLKKKVRKDKSK